MYSLRNVVKQWSSSGTTFTLDVPEMNIRIGEKIAVVGQSGCGKSTLLHLLAMTMSPSAVDSFSFTPPNSPAIDIGSIWHKRKMDQLTFLRKCHIGFILQTGGLLPFLNVRENIALSRRLLKLSDNGVVDELACRLGIDSHLEKRPQDLSIGERQRVAIARALAHRPTIIIADEPTSAVDPINADLIMDIFCNLADEFGTTVIIATHEWERVAQLGLRRIEARVEPQQTGTLSTFKG
ncbi:MAG: hypothetical protein BBJ57_05355 [Desulfobacterales bacterium PC51MH44]|nr:MAG: hypothetical protein BBJ57_05355 [Desulfobacterales bacterium PC51MH44]